MITRLTCLCCLLVCFTLNSQTWRLVTEPFPPFLIDNSEKPGWVHEVVIAALKSQNKKAVIEYTQWARALKLAKRHKHIAVLGAFYSEDRAKVFYYSKPLGFAHVVLFKRQDAVIRYNGSVDSLKPYTISMGEDYVSSEEFTNNTTLGITTTRDLVESLYLLQQERVDLVAGTQEVAEYWLAHNSKLQNSDVVVTALNPNLATHQLYIISAKSHPQSIEFQNELEKGLVEIINNGQAEIILNRYQLSDKEKQAFYSPFLRTKMP